jgi:diacylglycerol kinase family enzyme
MRRSLLIYNPAAGQWWSRPRPEHVLRELARHGWSADLLVTQGQDHATELVRAHLAPEVQAVWVCGGDGTLGQAVAGLLDTSIPVGILPSGTVNVVAREVGVPSGVGRALAALAHSSRTLTFRAWRVNGRAVVLGVGVGFDARAMGRVHPVTKASLGLMGIAARGVWEWARYDFPRLRVTGEDERGREIDLPATQVLATVPRHFAGHHVLAPAADPADDCIDLVLFRGASRVRLAAFWLGVELPGSAQLRVPGVDTLRARRVRIAATDSREDVHVNGDVVDCTPVDIERWNTVRFIAPERG